MTNNAFPSDPIHRESSLGRRKKFPFLRNSNYYPQIASGMKRLESEDFRDCRGDRLGESMSTGKKKRIYQCISYKDLPFVEVIMVDALSRTGIFLFSKKITLKLFILMLSL